MEEDKKRRRYNIHSILHPPVLGYIQQYADPSSFPSFPSFGKRGKRGEKRGNLFNLLCATMVQPRPR